MNVATTDEPDPYEKYRNTYKKLMRDIALALTAASRFGGRK